MNDLLLHFGMNCLKFEANYLHIELHDTVVILSQLFLLTLAGLLSRRKLSLL